MAASMKTHHWGMFLTGVRVTIFTILSITAGFSGIWDTGLFSGMSAIDWAMQPLNSQSCGCYSWNDVREYYYRALTSPDKRTREINFAETFRGLGQLMHLVQDMSVPDHVRNSSHILW